MDTSPVAEVENELEEQVQEESEEPDKYEGLEEILEELDSLRSTWTASINQFTPEEIQEFGL